MRQITLVIHPALAHTIPAEYRAQCPGDSSLAGVAVIVTDQATAEVKPGSSAWPVDRFVEYDDGDKSWLFGLGAVSAREPAAYLMDSVPLLANRLAAPF